MLEADNSFETAVVEMGMSGFGEIDIMSKVAKPQIACITNIGSSHMEILGSRENICRAKMEIVNGMNNGLLILNGDDPLLQNVDAKNNRKLLVGVTNENCDVRAVNLRYSDVGSVFDIVCGDKVYKDIEVRVIGKQFAYAALFAFAVGLEMGISVDKITEGLKNFENADMRQNIYEVGGITIIEDCYNASPESMRAAMDVQQTLAKKKKGSRMVALLGDMRELGENSKQFHKEIGRYYGGIGGNLLMTIGGLAPDIAYGALENGLKESNVYINTDHNNVELIGDSLLGLLRDGDILLVKASRAIGAERGVEYIKTRLGK
jgi:UDP-N-acetylmuramoyl-tripeptide--D-alanyl-D-alanine ligase